MCGRLVLGTALAPSHLLGLQVLIEEVKRRLIGLGASHDSKHTFTSLIMRGYNIRCQHIPGEGKYIQGVPS